MENEGLVQIPNLNLFNTFFYMSARKNDTPAAEQGFDDMVLADARPPLSLAIKTNVHSITVESDAELRKSRLSSCRPTGNI